MWYFGIFTALLSSILGGLGDNLIRLSFTLEEELDPKVRRPVILRPIWLLGVFFSCILNAVLIIISLNFASAMIVTPFSGLHIFWSILFSKYILNEEIRSRHYKGTSLVIFGLLFIIFFGLKDVPAYSVEELGVLYTRPRFLIYCFINVSFILICTYIVFFGLDVSEQKTGHSEIHINGSANNQNDNSLNIDNTEININPSGQTRDYNKDIIILSKNTFHLKISNLRDYMSKKRYIKYNNANDSSVLDDLDSSHSNSNSRDNIIGALNTINDDVVDEVFMNDDLDIKYGFGKEYNADGDGKSGFYGRLMMYTSIIEERIRLVKSLFFEVTKGFPRVQVTTPVKRFCICSVSGLVGGYTNVLVQNLIQIIVMDGIYVLLYRLTYQLFFTTFITGSIQWAFWNSALSKYQAIFVVPIVNSVLIASSGFCNLMLYYDRAFVSSSVSGFFYQMNFLFGQFLIVFGIYLISRARRSISTSEDDISMNKSTFELNENIQKEEQTSNSLLLNLRLKMNNLSDIIDFFKSKREKISSSLESLLGLSRNQDISNTHSKSSLPSAKYLRNVNQFHIDNTIILPQEEYDDINNNTCNLESLEAPNMSTGIKETCQEIINVENNYTSYHNSNRMDLGNSMGLDGYREEVDVFSQNVDSPNKMIEFLANNSSQHKYLNGEEHSRRQGIELESYVLDEYDIDDFDTPFTEQDYLRSGNFIHPPESYNCDQINTQSIISFGDEILEENITNDYYESNMIHNKDTEYPQVPYDHNNLNSSPKHHQNNNSITETYDSTTEHNPSLSTCSTNSSMLYSTITNIV
ncbi:hypothetical protein OIY81_1693 [Cryptosporidium canis]|nr:hypothetical protein OIY81_1693 [Cryptosporidium canis]